RTFSGAEEFAYDLQTQKRATIVGETTGGGANPGGPVRLPYDLTVFVPTGRAINPITKTNWEEVGVKPDVQAAADDALDVALRLAREAVGGKQ
ncbi:MAG TPA: S41 family peptidase, partial [Gemmatimonadaceae bacterium]|nr:S41 family peptidase [Gemmatimonadaceae bacterium]